MKKINVTLLAFFVCATLSAQYKKASFFGKEGRTYALGTRFYAMGDGKKTPRGYFLSFGRDQDGKRFFYNWELQYIPSYTFSFDTKDANDLPVTVAGRTKPALLYGYNFSFHLLNNESEKPVAQPYANLGFNIRILGGIKEVYNDTWDNKKVVADQHWSGGLSGGAGCLVNIASWFALKFEGGYTYQFNIADHSGVDNYYMLTKHPYASAGVRFRLAQD